MSEAPASRRSGGRWALHPVVLPDQVVQQLRGPVPQQEGDFGQGVFVVHLPLAQGTPLDDFQGTLLFGGRGHLDHVGSSAHGALWPGNKGSFGQARAALRSSSPQSLPCEEQSEGLRKAVAFN